jgi:GNAT superfamily N-acetyltransferase
MSMLTRRQATESDSQLIYDMTRTCMREYVVQTWGKWDEADQRKRFEDATPVQEHCILEVEGTPAGCFWTIRRPAELVLSRLYVLPAFQNRGIGTQFLRELLAEADQAGVPVRLGVLRVNPARRLYARHGFVVVGEDEVRFMMSRPVQPSDSNLAVD